MRDRVFCVGSIGKELVLVLVLVEGCVWGEVVREGTDPSVRRDSCLCDNMDGTLEPRLGFSERRMLVEERKPTKDKEKPAEEPEPEDEKEKPLIVDITDQVPPGWSISF